MIRYRLSFRRCFCYNQICSGRKSWNWRKNNHGKKESIRRQKREKDRSFSDRASVDGYPGAEYKSFLSVEEAQAYLNRPADLLPGARSSAGTDGGKNEEDQVVAYVDGSFNKDIGRYAFGCVLIRPDGGIVRESGSGNDPESLQLRNVTGEMLGAMYAVRWCAVNGYPAVRICYDYMGIEMWAVGSWRTNNSLTQKYAAFMRESGSRIRNITRRRTSWQRQRSRKGKRSQRSKESEAKGIRGTWGMYWSSLMRGHRGGFRARSESRRPCRKRRGRASRQAAMCWFPRLRERERRSLRSSFFSTV